MDERSSATWQVEQVMRHGRWTLMVPPRCGFKRAEERVLFEADAQLIA